MLTFLVAGIALMLLLSLLARIPLFRAIGSWLFCTIGILWIIGNHGGDTEFWGPWVFGGCMIAALIQWIGPMLPAKPAMEPQHLPRKLRCPRRADPPVHPTTEPLTDIDGILKRIARN